MDEWEPEVGEWVFVRVAFDQIGELHPSVPVGQQGRLFAILGGHERYPYEVQFTGGQKHCYAREELESVNDGRI